MAPDRKKEPSDSGDITLSVPKSKQSQITSMVIVALLGGTVLGGGGAAKIFAPGDALKDSIETLSKKVDETNRRLDRIEDRKQLEDDFRAQLTKRVDLLDTRLANMETKHR